MPRTYALALLCTLVLHVAPAHAVAPAGAPRSKTVATTAKKAPIGSGFALEGHTDRKIVRTAIDGVRIHANGENVVKDPAVKRLELEDGTKIALSYATGERQVLEHGYPAGKAKTATVRIHGAEGGSDVPLTYLDAKQRSEMGKLVAPLRDAFVAKGGKGSDFRIEFDKAKRGALRLKVAELSAVGSRAARNFLAMRELAPDLVK